MGRSSRNRSISGGSFKEMTPPPHQQSLSDHETCGVTSSGLSTEAWKATTQLMATILRFRDSSTKSFLHCITRQHDHRIDDASPLNHHDHHNHYGNNLALATALLDRCHQLDALRAQFHNSQEHGSKKRQQQRTALNAPSWRRECLLATDGESGYTPLHWAAYSRDAAALLFLLRQAATMSQSQQQEQQISMNLSCTKNSFLDPPRLTLRPMEIMQGDVTTSTSAPSATLNSDKERGTASTNSTTASGTLSSTPSSIWQAMIQAIDQEGLRPAQVLVAQQRAELAACRQALPRPCVVRPDPEADGSTTAAAELRRRRSSFDFDHDDDDDDDNGTVNEQNEFDFLHRNMPFLRRQNSARDRNSTVPAASVPAAHATTYGCEVVTFGQAHHCALGSTSTSSSGLVAGSSLSDSTAVRPQRVQEFAQETVGRAGGAVAVAGSTHHTLVCTAHGHLYAFGLGKGGRLGTGHEGHCPVPTRVRGPLLTRVVVAVAAAENHSLCVTKCGQVYAWGSNRFGQLGVLLNEEGANPRCLPRRVDDLKQVVCVSVAAGERHSVALSQQGEVYVWGDNSSGQLGHCRRTGVHKVQRVEALWTATPVKVATAIAASEQTTMVLTMPSGTGGLPVNTIYAWGHGNHVPTKVQFDIKTDYDQNGRHLINPVAIDCARYHHVAVTSDGHVFTWGLHEESLGTKSRSGGNTKSSANGLASPQLVNGMLPENGGGKVVAVSASENHTAVVTDTGLLYTWGATYGPNILGHEGVRWQPDPKRVPGVYRAVGVAAAKEHTVLLIGASFPPIPPPPPDSTLENRAARKIAEHVDLFNLFPILITAQRAQCPLLSDYCEDFLRRNIDGVLNVGQKTVMDMYLNEQIRAGLLQADHDRDGPFHPLLTDVLLAGNSGQPSFERDDLSSVQKWLAACLKLSGDSQVVEVVRKYSLKNVRTAAKPASGYVARLPQQQKPRNLVDCRKSSCSERCLVLTSIMEMSSKEQAEAKVETLSKEIRAVRKRLNQIAKLRVEPLELSGEQQSKIARQPQLEADLALFEPALEAVKRRLRELIIAEACDEQLIELENGEEDTETMFKKEKEEEPISSPQNEVFNCDICEVKCPNESSYTMHLSGRKHRNKVAQAAEEEVKQAAATIIEEHQRQQLLKPVELPSVQQTSKPANPWKTSRPCLQPMYSLPPPPHPVPDTLANPKGLREIMEEEARKSASLKTTPKSAPKQSQKPTPLQLPPGSAPPLKSLPWAVPATKGALPAQGSTSFPSLQLLPGTPPPLTSPPWAVPSGQSAGMKSSTPNGQCLSDFIPSPPPKQAARNPVPWASPKVSDSTTTPNVVSLRDIQQEEQEFKKVQVVVNDSKWYVERRERAGSLQEILKVEEKERENRIFLEEQFRIEKQIEEQRMAEKRGAEKTQFRKERQNKNRNRRARGTSQQHQNAAKGKEDGSIKNVDSKSSRSSTEGKHHDKANPIVSTN